MVKYMQDAYMSVHVSYCYKYILYGLLVYLIKSTFIQYTYHLIIQHCRDYPMPKNSNTFWQTFPVSWTVNYL